MEEFVSTATVIALAVKFTDFVKYLTNKDINGAVTQLTVWLAGIGAVLLTSAAGITEGIVLGGIALGDLDFWSAVVVGLGLSSTGSFVYDFKKSFDGTDSAKTPPLTNPTQTTPTNTAC